ncbi:uncharacterized protein SPPG_00384 [Spizellomyces punctatus DAOM BR117]|uniref:protein-tyrosine-phosphatase n=1 Tax=Spizellomyces punctatus (strain DAOM BR117) TaxID=645134 RepID=A0A0L0HUX9_SPIPD|nr:uncharacterized protein SPPG_00384 [Spizellomyces punctatus DAOM BR117]KND04669.1 hypothetical protein SPPG_00384 [Spizellomyces punctatus DAOM BR117]|eukprot:XP_016612708.1 hypothetical protein SPPG_00384 [Spizellomyces punctatus DAOM BR117]
MSATTTTTITTVVGVQPATRSDTGIPESVQNIRSIPQKMPACIPFARIMSTVEFRNLRFVILDCPTANTLPMYLEEMKNRGVTDVVRLCEPTYDKTILENSDIKVHDWPFKDGGIPPASILNNFLALCDDRFAGLVTMPKDYKEGTGPVIAVHCVAGLGRAPVLVTAALVEAGMAPLDAVEFVRRRRRGALNSVQLNWIVDSYKRQWKKGNKSVGGFLSKRPSSPQLEKDNASVHVSLSLKESFGRVFRFRKSSPVDQTVV